VTFEALDKVASAMQGPAQYALRWVAAACSVRSPLPNSEAATHLDPVTAIKGFTHMDQATVAGLSSWPRSSTTPSWCFEPKRGRSASVVVEVGLIFGGPCSWAELNRIQSNLIGNVLDAFPESGRVECGPIVKRPGVVRVIDSGRAF
jgi:hypothetical protein